MKIRIGEVTYDAEAPERLTLRQWLLIEHQTAQMGRRFTLAEYGQLQDVMRRTSKDERKNHPEILWILAVIVYAARVTAGEEITFEQAIGFPVTDLEFIAEDGDEVEPDPTPARPASGPGSGRRPADHKRKTSKPRSTAG